MFGVLRKTLGLCLVGIGIGILLVLLLPLFGWLFVLGVAIIIIGLTWLCC